MNSARSIFPLIFVSLLAACSGNLGGGQSTLPGMSPNGTTNAQQVNPPAATPTPVAASNVVSIGDSTLPQALPAVMGWGGTIAFAKPSAAPSPSPAAKAGGTTGGGGSADTAISVGITAGVVEPSEAPRFNSAGAKGRKAISKHTDANGNTGLFFISLLSTSDVTLAAYPALTIDMPRDVAAKYHDDTFGLALYDPETDKKTYRLAVAERDLTSPAPGAAAPSPSAAATLAPTPAPNGPTAFTPPPLGSGLDASGSGLPPEHIAFAPTAAKLKLKANRPLVFALYAFATASPAPSPAGSAAPSPGGSASPMPTVTGTPTAAPSSAPTSSSTRSTR